MSKLAATFAQFESSYYATCTINGRPASAEECADVGKVALAIIVPIVLIGLALFVWWIFTLVHVLKHEDVPNRVLWIVLHFVGLSLLAAPIYHFAVKRPYDRSHKSAPKTPAKTT
jgi:hypothetical protein